jgi:hypothetical protein
MTTSGAKRRKTSLDNPGCGASNETLNAQDRDLSFAALKNRDVMACAYQVACDIRAESIQFRRSAEISCYSATL